MAFNKSMRYKTNSKIRDFLVLVKNVTIPNYEKALTYLYFMRLHIFQWITQSAGRTDFSSFT